MNLGKFFLITSFIAFVATVFTGTKLNAQVLDSAYLKCTYNFSCVFDTSMSETRRKDMMILRIGKNASDFYSYNTFMVDSLMQADINNGVPAMEMLANKSKYGKPGLHYHILLNIPVNKITYTEKFISKSFKYEDILNAQDWHIQSDTGIVLNYKVQKAACSFGGRNWTAWFAPDIPVSYGPWKFNGLPGLILSVEDDKKYFSFVMTALQYIQPKIPIQLNIFKKENYIEISKQEMLKMEYKYYTDPFKFMNDNLGLRFTRTSGPESKPRSYIPIELY